MHRAGRGARRPNDQGSSARHRTSRLQPPATDSTHRLAQGSRAPLCEVVALPAARGCDDQPTVAEILGGAPTRTEPDPCRRPGRRLSEEIIVPASDQQSPAPDRRPSWGGPMPAADQPPVENHTHYASDQANWWARPVPATAADASAEGHAETARWDASHAGSPTPSLVVLHPGAPQRHSQMGWRARPGFRGVSTDPLGRWRSSRGLLTVDRRTEEGQQGVVRRR